MPQSLPNRSAANHLLRPDMPRARMAKAYVRKADTEFKTKVGKAVERMRTLAGLTLDELAGLIDRDSRQVARWITGEDRPHFDACFAVERLRMPLVIALAELVESGVEIDTVIRLRIRESA